MPAAETLSQFANADGVRLSYLIAGIGRPVVLFQCAAPDADLWRPLITRLSEMHTVIVPDLRVDEEPANVARSPDMKLQARDVHTLVSSLGHRYVQLIGHEQGAGAACAYAVQFPTEVQSLTLLEGVLPATDFAEASRRKLAMPVLVLAADNAPGSALLEQARRLASNVRGALIPGVDHLPLQEAPQRVITVLESFLRAPDAAARAA